MDNNELIGKRYVNLVRCSTDQQTETSIPAQIECLNAYAKKRQMIWAGNDIVLAGVSGSKPGNRTDLDELIERKRTVNDFDVVLALVEDRFSRGGAAHGMWAEYELLRHGITVHHANSDLPEGPYADVVKVIKYQAAQDTVKSTSMRSTQGYQRSLEHGTVATPSHTNYGLYRLYASAQNKPLFIIRDMRDGTQQKLHHETRQIIDVLGEYGGGNKGHYRKQKDEKVYMVPGDAQEIEVVRRIFRQRYVDGLGGHRIANQLNTEGIKAPWGGNWTQRQVEVIAENPIYTGWGISGRTSAARFYQRLKGNPQPVRIDPAIIATRKNLPVRLRPAEEWTIQNQPYLEEFLPDPLKSIASGKIKNILTQRGRPDRPVPYRNTKADSQYLLTGLIAAKQDGKLLKGQTCGPRDNYVRYYAHPTARKDPIRAGFPNTTFRADILEEQVLLALQATLEAMPDLRDQVRGAVESVLASQQPSTADGLMKWKKQYETISKKISVILEIVNGDTIAEAREKIAKLRKQQATIELLIKQAQQADTTTDDDKVEKLIDAVIKQLSNLADELPNLPTYQLRQVLAAMTASMTADMVTREVEMTLKLPAVAVNDAKSAISQLCLQQSSGSSISWQTQLNEALVLARIRCDYTRIRGKQCFQCYRLPRAA